MKGFLGIDLGSTTTKAIFLAPDGRVIGRGLTGTRANFETASLVARSAAIADAHLTFLREALEREPATASRAARVVGELAAELRRAALAYRLRRLEGRCIASLGSPDEGTLRTGVLRLFEKLRADPLLERDETLSGETIHGQAAAAAEGVKAPYEKLMGVFERALVIDEADPGCIEPREVVERLIDECRYPDQESRILREAIEEPVIVLAQAGTGYGRHRLPFAKEEIRSEILCHGLGARSAHPDTRTILDIGGQDTKAIQLDETGLVTSFQMNDRCAAGCGRYLGYVADELGIPLAELGPMAEASTRPARINSTCTVFAGTELRERLALGELREDVVAGLHRAIVVRAMSLLSRSGGVREALTFSGGVGRNPAVVKYLREMVHEHYGAITIHVSSDSIFNGAIGAALFARMDSPQAETGSESLRATESAKEAAAC